MNYDDSTENAAAPDRQVSDRDVYDHGDMPLYGQPFTAPDLVLAQVGWRDRDSGALFALNEPAPPIRIEATAHPRRLKAIYEVTGRHYVDVEPT